MPSIPAFAAAAIPWQNFYILTGTAAATLVGLMFVAVTFGASLVTPETARSARAFLDPPFNHFVQVLPTACMTLVPSMSATLLGLILLLVCAIRTTALLGIYRRMREAHRVHQDVELSDSWYGWRSLDPGLGRPSRPRFRDRATSAARSATPAASINPGSVVKTAENWHDPMQS